MRQYSERMRRLAVRVIARATGDERQTILSNSEWFVPVDESACSIQCPRYYNPIIGDYVERSLHLELIIGELYVYDSCGQLLFTESIGDSYDT